jgi:predicted RNA-binding Zn-ribbon protein involved in translation (DUF1610 family)
MGFLLTCDNKGCGETTEAVLDKDTNEVHCLAPNCGKVIKSVTSFTKQSMLSMGQIKRMGDLKKAFPVKCQACNKLDQPILDKDKLVCPGCRAELTTLAPAFAHVVKQFLGKRIDV